MKFFAALKSAEFASKLCAAADFDFAKAMAADDVNALKACIDALTTTITANVAKSEAAAAEQVAKLNEALESATKENEQLVQANEVLLGTLNAAGVKLPTAADGTPATEQIVANKAALESHIKIRAAAVLATTGHPAIADTPLAAGATSPAPAAVGHGRERYTADFNLQLQRMNARSNHR